MLDSNNIVGKIPDPLCARHDTGDLHTLRVNCDRGFIVDCKCCDCVGDSGGDSGNVEWNYNQKRTWSVLSTLSGEKLLDETSPQYKAAHWIVEEDKWHYLSSSSYLYQRYVLVMLYYMMGDQAWFAPDSDKDECKWERVGCNDEGYVQHIKFGKS